MPSLRRRQSAPRRTESFAQEQAGCSLSRKTLLSSPVRTQSYRGAVPTKKQPLFPKIFPPSGSGNSVLLEHLWHSSLHYISSFSQRCTRHKTWEVLHLPSRKIKHFFYNTVEKVKKKQSDRLGIQSDAAQECKTWYDDCSTMLPQSMEDLMGDSHITIFITMTNKSVVNATKNITQAECFYTKETTEVTAPQ